ncbi:Multidrug resistance protein MdtK [Pseudoalteromonas holothuriae]|uniref:Multidrug-efflux transporter n=1 Tax=Pseudoalteromonas holothuriae TaxID=2963714 RepID=A0ABM9GJH7_9GAMM|nr:MATE family efflux transporter [Pseudoalteromonas sp. CIP111951]CAH9061618.1 Multidrug resistance protein MdtK [Pseudoalteromonas sp. CIP111951]
MKFSLWESKRLLQLATPVFFAQITLVLMSVVDTMMAGQVSANDLAALSIATGFWNPLIFSLQGILLALTGIVAHCHGSKDLTSIKFHFQQSIYLALILAVASLIFAQFTPSVFSKLGTSNDITELSQQYIDFVKWGVLGFLLFSIYRNVTEGVGLTKPAFYISLIGLGVNVVANYIFIYGKLGVPAYGSAGCGLATALVFWAMAIAQWLYCKRSKTMHALQLLSSFSKPNLSGIAYIAKLGLPICLATLFEVTLFACIPLFIADLGAIAVSGHQIAASITAVLFMMPLSLSMAIAIRIGNLSGQKAYGQLKTAIFTSFCLATFIAIFVALLTFLVRNSIVWLYTSNEQVALLASSIIVLACIYQLPDALQVAANGVLRGLKYTKPISYITFVSYWLIGFTLGYVLAKTNLLMPAMGPTGFWIGIIVGLTVAAIFLLLSVRSRLAFILSNN